jgi:hypothetical protein
MIHDIETGAEFFFSEDDYLRKQAKPKTKADVKTEVTQPSIPPPNTASTFKLDKRPKRMAATLRSYVVPDSDDDDITDYAEAWAIHVYAKKRKVETNLQQWIKELSVLLKEEQRKVGCLDRKKRILP